MEYIKGPDFPTGATILGKSGIRAAYKTGRGKIIVRSSVEIETMNNGRERIVVTEIPYMVNKLRLIEKIADLVKDKKGRRNKRPLRRFFRRRYKNNYRAEKRYERQRNT